MLLLQKYNQKEEIEMKTIRHKCNCGRILTLYCGEGEELYECKKCGTGWSVMKAMGSFYIGSFSSKKYKEYPYKVV